MVEKKEEENILIEKSIIGGMRFNRTYEELPSSERKNVDNIWDDMLLRKMEMIKESPISIVSEP